MIQRIQSLYLFGAFICSVLLYFTAIASVTTSAHTYNFSIWGLVDVSPSGNLLIVNTTVLLIVNTLTAVFSLIIILRFKNRAQQIRFSRFNLLIVVAFAAGIFFYFENSLTQITAIDTTVSTNSKRIDYALGAVLPVIAILLTILAIRSIKKDEELVRSADRIR